MEKIFSAESIRDLDDLTINSIGIPSPVLMERAALSCVEELDVDPDSRIICICGSGNNGGDGIAIARILYSKGYNCEIYLMSRNHLSHECEHQLTMALNMGVTLRNDINPGRYDIIIDAIFGTGLSREVTGAAAEMIDAINRSHKYVLSVDVPSGIHSDTGNICGICVKADKTVTFGFRKTGLLLYPGKKYAGEVITADIGYGDVDEAGLHGDVFYAHTKQDLDVFRNRRDPAGNKGTFGKVLVIAGSEDYFGAAYMCAKAALRSGCGMVRVLTSENNVTALRAALPESMVSAYDACTDPAEIIEVIRWADAVVIGPGLGRSYMSEQILQFVLETCRKPLVIDADGLNILSKNLQFLKNNKSDIIITPHVGEMSRLTGTDIPHIQDTFIDCCRQFSISNNLVCVLKDAVTAIADPSGKTFLNTTGNSGMATAGSGDVLAGIIVSLCAQGFGSFKAATLGAYIHGTAGDEACVSMGAYSMTAVDIIENIYKVIK